LTSRVFCLLCIFLTSMGFAQSNLREPVPKQLAGPPSEFTAGPLREIQPGNIGVRSRSALLPVTLTQTADGHWQWRGQVSVPESGRLSLMAFAPGVEDWSLDLRGPRAKRAQPAVELLSEFRFDALRLGEEAYPGAKYRFDELTAGRWTLSLTAPEKPQLGVDRVDGYLLVGFEDAFRLYAHLTTREFLVGNEVGVVAYAFDQSLNDEKGAPLPAMNVLERARLSVATPSGERFELAMFDDGRHGDGAAADGVFGALFTIEETGAYQVQTMASGLTPQGQDWLRTAEHAFPALVPDVALIEEKARAEALDEQRMRIDVPLAAWPGAAGKYRAFAEVWGVDANGKEKPAAWIGGMVHLKDGAISLGLDARWLARAGVEAPLSLRNLRLEDVDHYVPLAKANHLPVASDRLPAAAYRATKTIDEAMRMGPRPPRRAAKAGARLLLVHGYCSGNVWGSVSGQFSNASVFSDFGQNRSHDQFAIQIYNFGTAYSSYGIVAHSQGGAASLHLYTYYWSGLDYASGSRLIQSVGTPYQGTSLAGNLALLGDIFGVGCGTNYDLTYNGAASWLSGIPSWARSQVHYFTTSFRDRWWAYDYCNIASDLVLDDPDDGTIERSKGQLSGAVNRGHKEGWCHTSGMRDPAQYTDSGRNADMNANAAR